MKEKEFKIPPKRIPSDDCMVTIGRVISDGQIKEPGQQYAIHKDEWVEVIPIGSMASYIALIQISQAASERADALDTLCEQLSERIVNWNWTDLSGTSLPKPYKNKKAFYNLGEDEILWLITAIQGETSAMRKNA